MRPQKPVEMGHKLIIRMALMLVFCAIVARSAPTFADGKRLVKNFLNQNCLSNDPMGCIDIAKAELIKSDREGHPIWDVYKLALRQIVNVKNIIENPDCNGNEYWDLLTLGSFSTGGYTRGLTPENSLSPLDSVIHLVSLKRAEKCRDVYVQRFNQLYSIVNSRSREIVEGFKHQELVEDKAGMNRREYMEWLIDYEFNGGDERNVIEAINYVKMVSSQDTMELSPSQLFEKYLFEPCRAYNNILDFQLAKQLRFDAKMFEGKSFYHLEEGQADSLVPLYQCMARTRFCQVIEDQSSFMDSFVEKWRNQSIREQMNQLPYAAAAA